jgi:hypothetical protein
MLGSRGNSVVAILNQYYQCNREETAAVWIFWGVHGSSYVGFDMI